MTVLELADDLEVRAARQQEIIDEPRGCRARLFDVKPYIEVNGPDLTCGEKRNPSFLGVELCGKCQSGKSYAIGARDALTATARRLRALPERTEP